MNVAQSKDADPAFGLGAELVVIASVIVGGTAIFGGRGRVIGSCLGAILVGLIDKVLREGVPITRVIQVGDEKMEVAAVSQLPPGAVPAFLGVILIIAVLIEPWLVRRRISRKSVGAAARPAGAGRFPILAASPCPAPRRAATTSQARGLGKRGIAAFFYRRDAAAVMLLVALWLFGFWARPDFWAGARQFLLDAARVFRDRAACGRPHLRDGQRRHRSFRRLGAGAFRRGRRRHHEGHRASARSPPVVIAIGVGVLAGGDQRLAHRLCRPSRIHRDARAPSTGRAASALRSWRARSSTAFPNPST